MIMILKWTILEHLPWEYNNDIKENNIRPLAWEYDYDIKENNIRPLIREYDNYRLSHDIFHIGPGFIQRLPFQTEVIFL